MVETLSEVDFLIKSLVLRISSGLILILRNAAILITKSLRSPSGFPASRWPKNISSVLDSMALSLKSTRELTLFCFS